MRQARFFLGNLDQMRRENHTTGVTHPVFHVQTRVIFGQERVAPVAKDTFHEVEVAHQIPRREETDLHRFLRDVPGNLGNNQRPQQKRDETLHWFRRRRKRKSQQLRRWHQRQLQQPAKYAFRHTAFVVWNAQPALRDVKNPLRRAAVGLRIVQNTLLDTIRPHVF